MADDIEDLFLLNKYTITKFFISKKVVFDRMGADFIIWDRNNG